MFMLEYLYFLMNKDKVIEIVIEGFYFSLHYRLQNRLCLEKWQYEIQIRQLSNCFTDCKRGGNVQKWQNARIVPVGVGDIKSFVARLVLSLTVMLMVMLLHVLWFKRCK